MSKAVYTSFDGDSMTSIDLMRGYVIECGGVPINPEHALGYYISTTCHNNNKREVMRDCVSLCHMADEFWIFHEGKDFRVDALSEGVIAELIYWLRVKNGPVKLVSLAKLRVAARSRKSYATTALPYSEEMIASKIGVNMFQEISAFCSSLENNLRPVVFVEIPDADFKYVDWVRRAVFLEKYVPIVPQLVIPWIEYSIRGRGSAYRKTYVDLRRRCAKVWGVSPTGISVPRYCVAETYETRSLAELGVPKYTNPQKWSITSKETADVILASSDGESLL